jgi:hypothetical protein
MSRLARTAQHAQCDAIPSDGTAVAVGSRQRLPGVHGPRPAVLGEVGLGWHSSASVVGLSLSIHIGHGPRPASYSCRIHGTRKGADTFPNYFPTNFSYRRPRSWLSSTFFNRIVSMLNVVTTFFFQLILSPCMHDASRHDKPREIWYFLVIIGGLQNFAIDKDDIIISSIRSKC